MIERRIWGSDIYTSDSDAVCILQHSGFFKIKELPPSNIQGVSVYFRVSKGRATYNSSFKGGIKSKKNNNFPGHSIKPENYALLKNYGSEAELLEMASKMPAVEEIVRKKSEAVKINNDDILYFTEFNFIFNLSFEMWMTYSLPAICDKGKDLKDYTSWKLKDKVLYIETNTSRYEIARNITDHTNDDYLFEEYETFKFSEVTSPMEKDNDFMIANVVPLVDEFIEVIYPRLDWGELEWGEKSLKVRDTFIGEIKCFNYYNMKSNTK